MLPEAVGNAIFALDLMKGLFETYEGEIRAFGDFPSLFLGLVQPDGGLEHYDGLLRVIDAKGDVLVGSASEPHREVPGLVAGIEPDRYREIIGETVEPWTYLKFPYYKPYGSDRFGGMYRVGPLARLNLCSHAGTERADQELHEFRQLADYGRPVSSSFHYHYARLIEIIHALEMIQNTLDDPEITNTRVRSQAGVNQRVGIGVSEAPRGTLFHEYHVDEHGVLEKVNMVIATGQNNLAMNETVKQIAKKYVHGDRLEEGVLNRLEAGVRAYDPCLSCSTHAVGQMPMQVDLLAQDGTLLDQAFRN